MASQTHRSRSHTFLRSLLERPVSFRWLLPTILVERPLCCLATSLSQCFFSEQMLFFLHPQ